MLAMGRSYAVVASHGYALFFYLVSMAELWVFFWWSTYLCKMVDRQAT